MGKYEPRDEHERTLLERARREYPVGTKYKGVDSSGLQTGSEWTIDREPSIYTRHDSSGDFYIEGGYDYVFVRGTWAEIVGKPPVISQDNYLVFN